MKNRSINFLFAALIAGALAPAVFVLPAQAEKLPEVHHVHIKSFKFDPPEITVKNGETIEFDNQDYAPHTATADDKSFDTGTLKNGETKRITVSKIGTIDYHCTFHPMMKAKIIIQ